MTKLEQIAAIALQGLLAGTSSQYTYTSAVIAKKAVEYAEALIQVLDKYEVKESRRPRKLTRNGKDITND